VRNKALKKYGDGTERISYPGVMAYNFDYR